MRRRTLVIGLDAAAPELVARWTAEGKLPTLQRLIESGAWGPLESVPNTSSPAAWSTFMTGKNPGGHGIMFFSEPIPGSYEHRFVNGSMRDGVAFWQYLSDAGWRVGIMNVPLTFPAEAVNGFFISGMDAPSAEHPDFAYPPDLMGRLRAELGGFIAAGSMSEAIGHDVLAGRVDTALSKLLDRMETRTRWAEHLIAAHRPDVMVVVYTETDAAAHFFWKFMDRRHPGWTPRLAERSGDAILRVYQKADEAVRRLMGRFGEATVLVLSDHGAGITTGTAAVTSAVLRELGLRVYEGSRSGPGRSRPRETLRSRIAATAYQLAKPRLSGGVLRRLRRHLPGFVSALKTEMVGRVDWSRTRAYLAGGPGAIWLNVKGREPAGIVEPGAEYEELRQTIAEAFRSCVDIDTGQPVVSAVHLREEIYHGPYVSRAPDLYVRLADGFHRGIRIGSQEIVFPHHPPVNPRDVVSGGHSLHGIVILHGAGVKAGAPLTGARLQEVAPTILYACGQPVPEDMEGAVLLNAFTPEHLAAYPVQYTSPRLAASRALQDFTEEEADAIQERLKNLGYL